MNWNWSVKEILLTIGQLTLKFAQNQIENSEYSKWLAKLAQ